MIYYSTRGVIICGFMVYTVKDLYVNLMWIYCGFMWIYCGFTWIYLPQNGFMV